MSKITMMFLALLMLNLVALCQEVKVGSLAPLFSLKDQNDVDVKLASFKGKPIVLISFDRDSQPQVESVAKFIREKSDAVVLRVAIVKGAPFFVKGAIVNSFKGNDDNGKPKPRVLMDWDGDVPEKYGFKEKKVNVVVIDKEGIVKFIGATNGAGKDLDALAECLVQEK